MLPNIRLNLSRNELRRKATTSNWLLKVCLKQPNHYPDEFRTLSFPTSPTNLQWTWAWRITTIWIWSCLKIKMALWSHTQVLIKLSCWRDRFIPDSAWTSRRSWTSWPTKWFPTTSTVWIPKPWCSTRTRPNLYMIAFIPWINLLKTEMFGCMFLLTLGNRTEAI